MHDAHIRLFWVRLHQLALKLFILTYVVFKIETVHWRQHGRQRIGSGIGLGRQSHGAVGGHGRFRLIHCRGEAVKGAKR